MKKILALVLALSLVFALAACGGNTEDETTTAAPVETTLADESTTLADETTTLADETTTLADESTTLADETTTAAADMTKAEFVAFLNAETAKIAKSGSYSLKRDCEYTVPIDVGSATGILNSIISAIDPNSNLNTVVGGFLGIGTTTGDLPKQKGDVNVNYQLKAANLSEGDLASFSAADGVYSFTLPTATNPQKNSSAPIAKLTNDFITHNEVAEGIADFTQAITLKESNVNYKNIKVEVKVVDGKIANIKYSYDFDATLALRAGLTINGSGAAKTTGVYSAIKY